MNTPFTVEQFLQVFKDYNQAVFPMQIVFYLLGISAVWLAVKSNPVSDKIISSILAFLWVWMGIAYHLIYFTAINQAAYLFAAIFVFQGILFVFYGVDRKALSFSFHNDLYGITAIILFLFALLVYPVIGYLSGHVYPVAPTFGLPCPTTIFTFGFLVLNARKTPLMLLVLPVLWSIVGFTAAFNFGIKEDIGLLIAGLVAFVIVLMRNRKLTIK